MKSLGAVGASDVVCGVDNSLLLVVSADCSPYMLYSIGLNGLVRRYPASLVRDMLRLHEKVEQISVSSFQSPETIFTDWKGLKSFC